MCDPSRCWLGLSKRSNLASALAGLGSSSLAPLCFHIDCCLLATSLPVVLSMSYGELHSISLVEINSPLLLVLPSVIPQKFTRFLTKAANLKSIHQMAPEHCIPRVQASLHLQENPEVPLLWDEKVQPQEPVQQKLIFPLQLPRVFNLGLYQRERDRIFLTFFIFIFPSLDSRVKSLNDGHYKISFINIFRDPVIFTCVCFTVLFSVLKALLVTEPHVNNRNTITPSYLSNY